MFFIAEPLHKTARPSRLVLTMPQQRTAPRARLRARHFGLLFSFLVLVVAPIAVTGWYLSERAADQYASRVGFSVRAPDMSGSVDLMQGGVGTMAGNSVTDADILYEFIQSQQMVAELDAELDLRALFSKPMNDPIFAFDGAAPVEELVAYWRSMVAITYDASTGLIELQVRAFAPDDAVAIATGILDRATILINDLSAEARADGTDYARADLDRAVERLKQARQSLARFRSQERIIDPSADVQGQMTVLISLQQQLAEKYVELDLLSENTRSSDTRIAQTRTEVAVIENRIEEERRKFGFGGAGDDTFSAKLAKFEELSVELEFAQTAYLSALAAHDAAQREARQQSRYLAAYLEPTRPESAEFPQRPLLLGLVALFSFLIWSLLTLVYYSLRDRG